MYINALNVHLTIEIIPVNIHFAVRFPENILVTLSMFRCTLRTHTCTLSTPDYKTSGFFLCFQGVLEENGAMKWVEHFLPSHTKRFVPKML